MATTPELKVSERDGTVTPRQLRAAGFVPATVYYQGKVSPQSVQLQEKEFSQCCTQGLKRFRLTGYLTGEATLQSYTVMP